MAQGQLDNYSLGSFGNSYSAVEKTVGAGVALATANGGSVSANISSLANGSMAMGAKTMAQTIGYGSEVHLSDAMVSGELSGITEGSKDNTKGSLMTEAEARALGTGSALGEITAGENWLKSSLTNSDGAFNGDAKVSDVLGKYHNDLEKQSYNK